MQPQGGAGLWAPGQIAGQVVIGYPGELGIAGAGAGSSVPAVLGTTGQQD